VIFRSALSPPNDEIVLIRIELLTTGRIRRSSSPENIDIRDITRKIGAGRVDRIVIPSRSQHTVRFSLVFGKTQIVANYSLCVASAAHDKTCGGGSKDSAAAGGEEE
jgi:hypothetical protein